MQIKLTKTKQNFFLMDKDADSKVVFKFFDAQLLVKSIRPYPEYLLAHHTTLQAGGIANYHLTRVEHKIFTFSSGSQSFSIDPIKATHIYDKEQGLSSLWTQTRFDSSIMISIIFHYTWRVNTSLAEACIWTWVTKIHPSWNTGRSSRHLAITSPTRDSR